VARPESIASAGFTPTQPELYDAIASLVRVTCGSRERKLVIADPCAGEGIVLAALAERWVRRAKTKDGMPLCLEGKRWADYCKLFACEMEFHRSEKLRRTISAWGTVNNVVQHGDAFLLHNDREDNVHVLFHNPPYDIDRGALRSENAGRLEQRWLTRFAPLVAVGGVLLHYVPYYTLSASAETIARSFIGVRCYRVPGKIWDDYHQVVLVGVRRPTLAAPDPAVLARVKGWSENPKLIPELPLTGLRTPVVTLDLGIEVSPPKWQMGTLDVMGLLDLYEPWSTTTRAGKRTALPNIEPEVPYLDLMAPRARFATAPRPTHIALAAGAGVLSGAELSPDDGQDGPPLLLKGVHRRTFRHLRWKEDDKGQRVGEERQHHPELQMSVLRLDTGEYYRLTPSVVPTGSADIASWTVGDLIVRYSGSMLAALRNRCDLLYDQTRPGDTARIILPLSSEPLLGGQAHAVRASLRLLQEPDRAVLVLGEIGVGKTRVALTTAFYQLRGVGRVLVLCPPTLVGEWKSEIAKVIDGAIVRVIRSLEDVDEIASVPATGFEVLLLTKETAKLGSEREGVLLCPRCGTRHDKDRKKVAERKETCETVRILPKNTAARVAAKLAEDLGTGVQDAQLAAVVQKVGGRILRSAPSSKVSTWKDRKYILRSVVGRLRRMVPGADWKERNKICSVWWSVLHAIADEQLILKEALRLFRSTLEARSEGSVSPNLGDVRRLAGETLLLLPPFSPWIEVGLVEMRRYRSVDAWGIERRLYDGSHIRKANRARRRGENLKEYNVSAFGAEKEVPTFGGRPWGSDESLTFAIENLTTLAKWEESDPCGEVLFQAAPKPRRIPLAQYILKKCPNLFDFLIIDEAQHYGTSKDSAQSRAAQQLLSLRMRRRIPTMALTGTIMNGYARSLFVILWHLSSAFREEFGYHDDGEFERRYGFLVQLVDQVDEKKQVVVYGSTTDRVTTRTRTTRAAPGVLPTALIRYLYQISVTLQHSDLEHDLPPCHERLILSKPSKAQRDRGRGMEEAILGAMKKDRFSKEGRAGKLFGALAHQPRYYDHATSDTGNRPNGSWTVAYPNDTPGINDPDDAIVAMWPGLPPETQLSKEQDLLTFLRERIAAGRNAVVGTTRTVLGQRVARILREELGVKVALLDTKKVSAAKRRDWIVEQKEAGVRVLVTNPAAMPEGLNVLVGYFTAVAIFDDPNNNPTLLRQFRGRFVRIGMEEPVDFWTFAYKGTLQEDANDLLQKKRVVATATDGLDASSAFEVAGVGEGATFESDLGKALYARMTGSPA